MKRREFMALVGGAATAALPFATHAQQSGKLRTVGFMGQSTRSAASEWVAAFVQRLHELGWIEGGNIAIEYRWAEGREERFAGIAAEFVRLKVDVIFTTGAAVAAAKKRSHRLSRSCSRSAGIRVGSGYVTKLARPDGNVTGLSSQSTDLVGKRLERLREVVPGLRRLAVMANVGYSAGVLEMGQVQAATRALDLPVAMLEIRTASDIAPAFETLKDRADAIYVVTDPLVIASRIRINTFALGARLPTMHGFREGVEAAGLISYGPNFPDQFRRAAEYVDKILRGAKPADLPVEQPTRFDLIINLTTAKALGLNIPEGFLLRADEVIE
jgi:putative ABC transport system substrate-binding protein